jgi:hypothetical protein
MNIKSLIGAIDYWTKDQKRFYPWGFAMNGQTSRLETTRQIIHSLEITRIVETGTYRGTTTEWFSQFGVPVETVELHPRFAEFSRRRLANRSNVALAIDSSVPFLKKRVSDKSKALGRQLFYLDSHWENHLPLKEELQLIFENYGEAVVLIDDFKVEDDPGYGFDSYSPEKTISLDYVMATGLRGLRCFYPATPSAEETGARRGWAVITSNDALAAKLAQISLLREYHRSGLKLP